MTTHETTTLAAALIIGVASDPTSTVADLIWAPVLGRPLLAWSIEPFLHAEEVPLERREAHDPDGIAIGWVIIVVAPEHVADAEALRDREGWSRPPRRVIVVPGGPRRRDAVRAGLADLPPQALAADLPPSLMEGRGRQTTPLPIAPPPGERSRLAARKRSRVGADAVAEGAGAHTGSLIVVIHDAARPLVTSQLIEAALVASTRASAATAIEPVKETRKLVRDGRIAATLPREDIVRAQTPQVFHLETLLAAHDACGGGLAADLPPSADPADDAALVLAAGLPLATFPGSPDNLMVRTAADLAVVERLLAARQR